MLKAFLDRRRSKKIAQKVLESVRDLSDVTPDRQTRTVEVAFISIRAGDADAYSERSAIVMEVADQNEGHASSIVPIMIVTFGLIRSETSGACLSFIEQVQLRLPGLTSIVHGTISASVGPFGGPERQDFGFWWPHTLAALRQLAALAPGESATLPSERNA